MYRTLATPGRFDPLYRDDRDQETPGYMYRHRQTQSHEDLYGTQSLMEGMSAPTSPNSLTDSFPQPATPSDSAMGHSGSSLGYGGAHWRTAPYQSMSMMATSPGWVPIHGSSPSQPLQRHRHHSSLDLSYSSPSLPMASPSGGWYGSLEERLGGGHGMSASGRGGGRRKSVYTCFPGLGLSGSRSIEGLKEERGDEIEGDTNGGGRRASLLKGPRMQMEPETDRWVGTPARTRSIGVGEGPRPIGVGEGPRSISLSSPKSPSSPTHPQRLRSDAPPGEGEVRITMAIPRNKVGLVIGPGGETVRDLQGKSGARICVELRKAPAPSKDWMSSMSSRTNGVAMITGREEATVRAQGLIQELVTKGTITGEFLFPSSTHLTGPSSSSSSSFSSSASFPEEEEEVLETVEVPDEAAAMIIGRGGETVRSLQLASGAKIQVERFMKQGACGHRRIHVSGTEEKVEVAKRCIREQVEAYQRGEPGGCPDPRSDTVHMGRWRVDGRTSGWMGE
ncbi:hypothetical protein BJ684DRAFT_16203 [Piptocephalis cylindrospora]|uniref:K Homology domain-containing protein n=1 Tax=Piptocephalis cylindrospora TaxID=1907219 RepID=A0A4P9Y383_9FUNG|nr:hypothetical protein BJ684DRAFT_16203 [Piptocephalis cylindrospora]|eukprot:RKP13388.1 hypothetical protein BJ684DRAFT_16203 [Piptocephalis cylindrospora]